MKTLASTPGLRFEAIRPRTERSPLRSDIAGFVGRTHRGPVNRVVRVEGWREYQLHFGGLDEDASMSYAIRGYFENGGQIAHIHRVTPDVTNEGFTFACGDWVIAKDRSNDSVWALPMEDAQPPALVTTACKVVKVVATSPGNWAQGMMISIDLSRLQDDSLRFDFQVRTKHGERERFQVVINGCVIEKSKDAELDGSLIEKSKDAGWADFERIVAEKSSFIRIEMNEVGRFNRKMIPEDLTSFGWQEVTLNQRSSLQFADSTGVKLTSIDDQYSSAVKDLMEELEVAMVVLPNFERDIVSASNFLSRACRLASQTQDRLLIADIPPDFEYDSFFGIGTSDSERQFFARCITFYEPRLKVNTSTGSKTLNVSASGHVAGVMSRIDRERGAHHTPANVTLLDAVDLAESTWLTGNAGLSPAYFNQIRCTKGRGLMIWGGRTLDESSDGRFIAHRRFIHRLIRAIRRVAEPIVFEVNSPELRRMLTRAVTTVLLEAYRGGALLGERPDEAFFVTCDDSNNPYVEREFGRVSCEIGLALAAPMEFIRIRVLLGQDGSLEVFES